MAFFSYHGSLTRAANLVIDRCSYTKLYSSVVQQEQCHSIKNKNSGSFALDALKVLSKGNYLLLFLLAF